MRTSEQYRAFAEQCLRWAHEAKTELQQKMLLDMAEVWKTLAEGIEKKN